MLVTVRGTYENGVVRFSEPLPTDRLPAGEVLITFLASKPERAPGVKPHKKPRFSFDKALALTADTNHVQVADEVEAERTEED